MDEKEGEKEVKQEVVEANAEEDEEEEARPALGIHVISTSQLEESISQQQEQQPRIVNGRKVIEVTKEFHEISMSDSESDLNTTNEDIIDVR